MKKALALLAVLALCLCLAAPVSACNFGVSAAVVTQAVVVPQVILAPQAVQFVPVASAVNVNVRNGRRANVVNAQAVGGAAVANVNVQNRGGLFGRRRSSVSVQAISGAGGAANVNVVQRRR